MGFVLMPRGLRLPLDGQPATYKSLNAPVGDTMRLRTRTPSGSAVLLVIVSWTTTRPGCTSIRRKRA